MRLPETERYTKAVAGKSLIAENQLVITRKGGNVPQGTWIHEKLILKLASWLNVDFEIWCDERIAELLCTGQTQLASPAPVTAVELILQQAQVLVEQERQITAMQTTQTLLAGKSRE